jgi:hypothetical protein
MDCLQTWTAATEDEYRKMLAKLLNVPFEKAVIHACAESSSLCHMFNGVCTGDCPSLQFCMGVFDPGQGLVGCACQ